MNDPIKGPDFVGMGPHTLNRLLSFLLKYPSPLTPSVFQIFYFQVLEFTTEFYRAFHP